MNEETIALMGELVELPHLWGVQHLPEDCPLGAAGYVVNIGYEHFWAADLPSALRRALAFAKGEKDAIRRQ
jgi:hypothetical protein